MIYYNENTILIPRSSKQAGNKIALQHLVTKKEYEFNVEAFDLYYKLNDASLNLPDGQYSYKIGSCDTGIFQKGDFNVDNKSYTTKISYKQYNL